MEKLFEMILVCAQAHKLLPQSELKTVIADTTVQEKAISYPLDSKLYYNMRERLVKAAASYGIELRQSYVRVAKKSLLMCSRYAHAKQYKRMRRELKRLKGYLARVYRDMDRKTKKLSEVPLEVTELLHLSNRLLNQKVKDKKKLYAIHAPEVECIAKGKAHKKYEFGVKASIVATVKSGWILCSHSLHGNPYDGHTLESSLSKAKELSGADIKEVHVDRGYKGHGVTDVKVYCSGQKRGVTQAIKKRMKRRSSIEPIIGHLKSDHGMDRNFLKGELGDKINAISAGMGMNLKHVMRLLTPV